MIKQVTESVLFGGRKRGKDELIFAALGDLDEASCFLGSARVLTRGEINKILLQLQQDLGQMAALIAGDQSVTNLDQRLAWLEDQIKKFQAQAPETKGFVFAGRNELEVRFHLARVVVRRLERQVVALSRKQAVPESLLNYLNRLSWLLFLFAATADAFLVCDGQTNLPKLRSPKQ